MHRADASPLALAPSPGRSQIVADSNFSLICSAKSRMTTRLNSIDLSDETTRANRSHIDLRRVCEASLTLARSGLARLSVNEGARKAPLPSDPPAIRAAPARQWPRPPVRGLATTESESRRCDAHQHRVPLQPDCTDVRSHLSNQSTHPDLIRKKQPKFSHFSPTARHQFSAPNGGFPRRRNWGPPDLRVAVPHAPCRLPDVLYRPQVGARSQRTQGFAGFSRNRFNRFCAKPFLRS